MTNTRFDPAQIARAALESSPHLPIRRIRVEATGAGLVISGRVESFFLKQMAQETVRDVAREISLSNRIEVGPAEERFEPVE